jgi:hypothetical protein
MCGPRREPLNMPTPLPARCADCCTSTLASSTSCRISVDRSDVTSEIGFPTNGRPRSASRRLGGDLGAAHRSTSPRAPGPSCPDRPTEPGKAPWPPRPGGGPRWTGGEDRRRKNRSESALPSEVDPLGVPNRREDVSTDPLVAVTLAVCASGQTPGEAAGPAPRRWRRLPGTRRADARANARTSSITLPGSRSSVQAQDPAGSRAR